MNYFLLKQKGLFDTSQTPPRSQKVRRILTNPMFGFILFGVIMIVVGFLAKNKIVIPYSWGSALSLTLSYAIASVGFCLLMGYSGLASLGTGGFIGIGTYSAYYVMNAWGLPFILALALCVTVAIICGMIVGFISLRIEGIYLAILTLGLSEILRFVFQAVKDSISLSSFNLFGVIQISRTNAIYLVAVMFVIIMIITNNIINSPTGRAMLAMKNSTAAAQAMGISLMKYRLLAFVICTVYAALAGTLLMISVGYAKATDAMGFYAMITSLNILAAVVIGGAKSIWGTLVGTFIMYGLQRTLLNQVQFFIDNPVVITFISGILVVLVVMFYPGGLAQLAKELVGKIKKLISKIKAAKYGKDV